MAYPSRVLEMLKSFLRFQGWNIDAKGELKGKRIEGEYWI